MSYNIKGKVYLVGETVAINDKLSKRRLVIETTDNPKYPQLIETEAMGDRCALIDPVNVGDSVSIEFDLRGREWKPPGKDAKFFVSLSIYKLEVTGKTESAGGGYGGGGQDQIPFASCELAMDISPIAKVLR